MKEVKSISIFIKINTFIFKKTTGTPKQFADRLNMSLSNLKRYIYAMRKAGAPIKFSRELCTYYYEKEGKFVFGFIEV